MKVFSNDNATYKKNYYEILNFFTHKQATYETYIRKDISFQKGNGVFFTNSQTIISDILSIIDIDANIFSKKILEPACGQGIIILQLLLDIYKKFPNESLISNFISNNIYFIDINKEMITRTESNIKTLYKYLFKTDYQKGFNSFVVDFTYKKFFTGSKLYCLYNSFDYIIGNPPYVSLYGRRDKKRNEEQRQYYLENYAQFPRNVKNGKLNYIMLFLEHGIDFLKTNGKLSFIIDVSFFETAYKYTRKYLLENTTINKLKINISSFDVASGQVILQLSKGKANNNIVEIIDNDQKNSWYVKQNSWENEQDEYKFRYKSSEIFNQILLKIQQKKDLPLLRMFSHKNLRTCTMLLDMEKIFTSSKHIKKDNDLIFPYYRGSQALSEKFGYLSFEKYFHYNTLLQKKINDRIKKELLKKGIKNKKRIGLGEKIIYDNPKIYIRQSAKEIIATIDLKKSAANNSLYVFSLRNNTPKTLHFLYFLCGFLNTDLVTYYAQNREIIRFHKGKQPQIKISDLQKILIPLDCNLQNKISVLCKEIFSYPHLKDKNIYKINALVYNYYKLTKKEIKHIQKSIKSF